MLIKNENYYVVLGFMVKDLMLKGNELSVYAIIYGFTQGENQKFSGSLKYLADWTNSTKQGIMKTLKSLLDKKLIEKNEYLKNGIKFVEYYTTEFNGMQLSCIGGNQSLPNNIDNNKEKENYIKIKYIVDFLNSVCGTAYKSTSKTTQMHINARLNEGYTVADFKTVIDNKYAEWHGTEFEKFLRPETLFGTKFESYLNGKVVKTGVHFENERTYTKEELDSLISNIDDIDFD